MLPQECRFRGVWIVSPSGVRRRLDLTSGSGGMILVVVATAIFKNRPSFAQLCFLLGIKTCVTQIDEVEIHAVYVRSTQICSAEIGFADFLNWAEILFGGLVSVEAGARAFAGNWAVYQAGTG